MKCFLLTLFCCFLISLQLYAQKYDSNRVSVLFPRNNNTYKLSATIGATTTFVPRPIAEEEIRQIPFVDANFRYNLPYSFALTARLGTNYLTNLASVGVQWSVDYGRFSIAVGDNSSLWYGFAYMDNSFDISALGWLNSPHVSFGVALDELLVTFRGEMLFVTSRSTRAGEIEVVSEHNMYAGGSIGVYTEQPFFRNTHLLLGLKINNLSNAYQSWLAFSTFNDSLIYPEFSIGVIL